MPGVPKPSDALKRAEDYDKSELPKYASRVDLGRVKGLPSFMDFLRALGAPA